MPAHSGAVTGIHQEVAALEELAAELTARGLHSELCIPAQSGKLPYLNFTNSRVSVLTEKVFAQAGTYWFSGAEKIAGYGELTKAADTIARVLSATGNTASGPPVNPGGPAAPADTARAPRAAQGGSRTPNAALREWRESAGLTRVALADALNDTPTGEREAFLCDGKIIHAWETGRTRWPSPRYRQALRELTGRDPQALGFTPPPRRPAPGSTAQPG
jgi:hypothetical protein